MKLSTVAILAQASSLFAPSFSAAVPTPVVELEFRDGALQPRQATSTRVPDAACTNGPSSRGCWREGFSIATDFDAKLPPAGKTITYNLEITNTTMAPGGHQRLVLAINNQYPGPTLYADWGDTMIINVKNSMQHNGTSMHWHGLRQLNSCMHDGVNGVTECPIAPGQTKQYIIRCTQFGTSWYHSHYSAQYGDGIVGGIVINGPATANYDTDLGTMTFTDWFDEPAFAMNVRSLHSATGPPTPQSALINGTMKRSDTMGSYHVTKVTKGKKFRLRLINTGIDNLFHVSIDNHNFTVITSDFVPIKPYNTNSVAINIGQRYDIIINATQDIGNYWLRADVGSCGPNGLNGKILSIIRYDGAPISDPTTVNTITKNTGCYDESVTPYVSNLVPEAEFDAAMETFTLDFNATTTNDGRPLIQWLIDGSDIRVDWSNPSLQNVIDGNWTFEVKENVHEISVAADKWTFWVIQTVQNDPVNLPHPLHLHGHDFYVLGSGSGAFDGDKTGLKFSNPPRRDTATLPAGGYLVIGFPADNPGVWLMHCHIPWHVGQGLSLQFLERKEEILGKLGNLGDYQKTCENWRAWWSQPLGPGRPYDMEDSGL